MKTPSRILLKLEDTGNNLDILQHEFGSWYILNLKMLFIDQQVLSHSASSSFVLNKEWKRPPSDVLNCTLFT